MTLDLIAQLLWCLIPLTPLIAFPLSWVLIPQNLATRLFVGLLFTLSSATVFYSISLLLLFRHGMGPA